MDQLANPANPTFRLDVCVALCCTLLFWICPAYRRSWIRSSSTPGLLVLARDDYLTASQLADEGFLKVIKTEIKHIVQKDVCSLRKL